jgi:hypothetical protein
LPVEKAAAILLAMQRGFATFTLDTGQCPRWLFARMVKLGREMTRVLIEEFGPDEFIRRIADPVWFQSLGTVLAFDWNASGPTTILMAALKEAIRGNEKDLGAEGFAFDAAKIEPTVATHKVCDGFELTGDKRRVVTDDGDAEDCDFLAVVVVDFRNGYIESALQPADDAFDDAAFFFERADTLQMQISCHYADYHRQLP